MDVSSLRMDADEVALTRFNQIRPLAAQRIFLP